MSTVSFIFFDWFYKEFAIYHFKEKYNWKEMFAFIQLIQHIAQLTLSNLKSINRVLVIFKE